MKKLKKKGKKLNLIPFAFWSILSVYEYCKLNIGNFIHTIIGGYNFCRYAHI